MHVSYYPISRSPFLFVQNSWRPNASIGWHFPESIKCQDHPTHQLNPVSAWTQVLDSREAFLENPSISHTISFPSFFFSFRLFCPCRRWQFLFEFLKCFSSINAFYLPHSSGWEARSNCSPCFLAGEMEAPDIGTDAL